MLTLSFHLKLAGILLIGLSFLHVFFPRYFNWKEEFSRVSLLSRQMFYVHCFFLVLTLVLMGVLSVLYTEDLLDGSRLARAILGGLSLFWGIRLLFQWFVYDRALWKGKPFERLMHILFSLFWIYLTSVYGIAAYY